MEDHLIDVYDQDIPCWYPAQIVDIKSDKFIVEFDDIKLSQQNKEISPSNIRLRSMSNENNLPEFEIGDIIEVFTQIDKNAPFGWATAIIQNKRNAFCYLHFDSEKIYNCIVEKRNLRPVNKRGGIDINIQKQKKITIPNDLLIWSKLEDSKNTLKHIRLKSSCIIIEFNELFTQILLIGGENEIQTASMLLGVAFRHQTQILRTEKINQAKREQLEKEKQKITEGELRANLMIENEVMQFVVAKDEQNIENIKKKYSVTIVIGDKDDDEFGYTKLQIFARNEDQLKEACKVLALKRIRIAVRNEHISFLKERFREIEEDSGAVSLSIYKEAMKKESSKMKIIDNSKRGERSPSPIQPFAEGEEIKSAGMGENVSRCLKYFGDDESTQGEAINEDSHYILAIGTEDSINKLCLLFEQHLRYFKEYKYIYIYIYLYIGQKKVKRRKFRQNQINY